MVGFITSNTPFHHFKKSFRMIYLFKQLNLSTLYLVSIFCKKRVVGCNELPQRIPTFIGIA